MQISTAFLVRTDGDADARGGVVPDVRAAPDAALEEALGHLRQSGSP